MEDKTFIPSSSLLNKLFNKLSSKKAGYPAFLCACKGFAAAVECFGIEMGF